MNGEHGNAPYQSVLAILAPTSTEISLNNSTESGLWKCHVSRQWTTSHIREQITDIHNNMNELQKYYAKLWPT